MPKNKRQHKSENENRFWDKKARERLTVWAQHYVDIPGNHWKKLGAETKCNPLTIQRIIKGKVENPGVQTLEDICEGLTITLPYLLTGMDIFLPRMGNFPLKESIRNARHKK